MAQHDSGEVESEEEIEAHSAAFKLFDLRLLIGGLFTLYGVMLTIYSFFTTAEQLTKAAGININLWLGLGMLILGLLFLLWARLRPIKHEAVHHFKHDEVAGEPRPPMH
jgi:prolipoprotein diacylglyceryltransferase